MVARKNPPAKKAPATKKTRKRIPKETGSAGLTVDAAGGLRVADQSYSLEEMRAKRLRLCVFIDVGTLNDDQLAALNAFFESASAPIRFLAIGATTP